MSTRASPSNIKINKKKFIKIKVEELIKKPPPNKILKIHIKDIDRIIELIENEKFLYTKLNIWFSLSIAFFSMSFSTLLCYLTMYFTLDFPGKVLLAVLIVNIFVFIIAIIFFIGYFQNKKLKENSIKYLIKIIKGLKY